MKVSFNWLKDFVDIKVPLPRLADLLTMHSFEVGSVEKVNSDYVLNVEVLPNRAHDCLSHIGIAREAAALLNGALKIKTQKVKEEKTPVKELLSVEIREPELCRRYIGRVIRDIKVGPSPKWLKDRLEAVGQKSINSVVDATNYVMFELGQPLHAFDLDKVKSVEFPISLPAGDSPKGDKFSVRGGSAFGGQFPKKIIVRKAKKGEKIMTLDGDKIELDENVLVIADEAEPLALAGIKGGKKAEIDTRTKNVVLEAANFEPTLIRRAAQSLGLKTESSLRFEHGISPSLAEAAMERLAGLIGRVAGGKIAKGSVDEYPKKPISYFVGIRPKDVESVLGRAIPEKEIAGILKRLGFEVKKILPLDVVLKTAKGLLGKPYKFGASVTFEAPRTFDCSSFTAYCFSRAGIQLHRVSAEQFLYDGAAVDKDKLEPGDLVFSKGPKPHFYKETSKGIGHVGIYIGQGKVLHAAGHWHAGKVIVESLAKAPSFKNYGGAKRILTEQSHLLLVKVPPERLDVRIKADVVEEVARVYGYEKIPSLLPTASLVAPKRNDLVFWERMAGEVLVGAGFHEAHNYSFAGETDVKSALLNPATAISLQNPVSDEKRFLRPTLLIRLIRNVGDNFRFFDEVKIFETGKVFSLAHQGVSEKRMLAGVIASKPSRPEKGRTFYEAKGALDGLFDSFGISDHWYDDANPRSKELSQGFWHETNAAEIKIRDARVGFLGEVRPLLLNRFDVKGAVAAFELDFEAVAGFASEEYAYAPISKYPAILRDIALLVPLEIRVEEVLNVIENIGGALLEDTDLFDMYEGAEFSEGMKSLAFRLTFQSRERTLSDKEVGEAMAKIINAVKEKGWEVR